MTVVVGNGTEAIGRGLGKRIDGCGSVVRCNEFRLHGFEEDLGRRTTDHMVHYGIKRETPAEACRWTMAAPRDYVFMFDGRADARHVVPLSVVLAAAEVADLDERHHASCGLVAIMHRLVFEDQVAIVGFDHASTGHYWRKDHVHAAAHDWDKERECVEWLIGKGRVVRW